jgi:hypothetical protein
VEALRRAGWHENRQADVSDWVEQLAGQGHFNDLARQVLTGFGGLSVQPVNEVGPNFENGEPLNFDPIDAGFGHHLLAEEMHESLGGNGSASLVAGWLPLVRCQERSRVSSP